MGYYDIIDIMFNGQPLKLGLHYFEHEKGDYSYPGGYSFSYDILNEDEELDDDFEASLTSDDFYEIDQKIIEYYKDQAEMEAEEIADMKYNLAKEDW